MSVRPSVCPDIPDADALGFNPVVSRTRAVLTRFATFFLFFFLLPLRVIVCCMRAAAYDAAVSRCLVLFQKRQLTNDRRLSRSGDAGRRRVSQPAVVADDQRLGGPAVERRVGADRLRVADHAVDDRRRTRPARQRHPDRLQRSSVGRRAPQRQRRHLARSLPGDLA